MNLINYHGAVIDKEEFFDRRKKTNGRTLMAIDMDNTMFDNDLGVLVFLEKLGDPHFWDFPIEQFASLALPSPYQAALREGADGLHGENMPPGLCRLALDLHADIVQLYALMKKMVMGKRKSTEEARVVKEFARKMVELDRIFIKADAYLAKLFRGQLLMRTRFFAGKEPRAVHRLTERVMERKRTDIDRMQKLEIAEENRFEAHQLVTEERISDIYGEASPLKQVDRLVVPIDEVKYFIRRALMNVDTIGVVATANLQEIGKTAVRRSKYDFLMKQGEEGTVIGSRLRKRNGTLHPRLRGKPVLGDRKAFEALKYAESRKRKLGIAMGDSPATDGPMMCASLIEGGAAIIVAKDMETARQRFTDALRLREIGNGVRERVFFILAPGT